MLYLYETYGVQLSLRELLSISKLESHAVTKLYKKELFDGIRYPINKKMEEVFWSLVAIANA